MRLKNQKFRCGGAACLSPVVSIFLMLISSIHAAVTVVWREDASGVTATYSGSMVVTSFGPAAVFSQEIQPAGALRNNQAFSFFDGALLDRYDMAGDTTRVLPASGPTGVPGIGSGDVFGFSVDSIFVPSGYVSGSSLAGEIVFTGNTLSDLFNNSDLALLQAGNVPVWESTLGNETVTYSVVPEPSSLMLLGCVGVVFMLRRTRFRS